MQYINSIVVLAFAATKVFAHGVITEVQGANGVNMPGLSGKLVLFKSLFFSNNFTVIDGTPRDCATPGCGAEADTSIIRADSVSPLGKTNGGGAVSAATIISAFMNGSGSNTSSTKAAREFHKTKRGLLSSLAADSNGGTKTPKGTVETGVKAATGSGASSSLPTCADNGTVSMTFHQVNQDGAGPLTASIDATSGGTDASAFKTAAVTQNVPGIGIGGLSAVTTTDFSVQIQMPAGMTCSGTVADVSNVCVAKLQNSALAGPFGGSVAFTQSPAAKKRAVKYNLAKRRFARGLVASEEE